MGGHFVCKTDLIVPTINPESGQPWHHPLQNIPFSSIFTWPGPAIVASTCRLSLRMPRASAICTERWILTGRDGRTRHRQIRLLPWRNVTCTKDTHLLRQTCYYVQRPATKTWAVACLGFGAWQRINGSTFRGVTGGKKLPFERVRQP